MTPHDAAIQPAPSDDEAAAIIAAIMAHLAANQPLRPESTSPPRAWSLAGRLASQGQPLTRPPGTRPTWANAARLERMRRDG